jgi:N-6 DNA Methylase/TaqI-like C-terminal specificity domain
MRGLSALGLRELRQSTYRSCAYPAFHPFAALASCCYRCSFNDLGDGMAELTSSFISKTFLRSHWDIDFKAWVASGEDARLLEVLNRWHARADLKETSAESAFLDVFFRDLWGYRQSGQAGAEDGFTLYPKFAISGAGANGGKGEADLAIGYFTSGKLAETPQVLCEFKDMKSALDADQKRKGNTRSPVKQCLDYLSHARRGIVGSEPIVPTWGLVTDMNEFRLYWYDRGLRQSLRFVIQPRDLFQGVGLLSAGAEAQFDRFLFARVFHRDALLTKGGKAALLNLINQQRFNDRKLEQEFYTDYRRLRDRLYLTLLEHNAEGTDRFPGTRGRMVRLAQKLLDRMIFVFYCEDMGAALAFPPQLLRDFLTTRSNDPYFDAAGFAIWDDVKRLFTAMNDGIPFGTKPINKFNGGLFAPDPALERLRIPNIVFCQHFQGQNDSSLATYKDTLLYLCASYNYASTWAQGLDRPQLAEGAASPDAAKNLGLYTLGRIFEQSITELEILEAEADGRESLNKISKRKRDGVYYTPEWVVERIVEETLGPRLAEIKRECGWRDDGLPTVEAMDAFADRLKVFTVLDPACGSGAFLITTLRYLVDTWRSLREMRKTISGNYSAGSDDDAVIRLALQSNIYGVDINPASIEIARLALWLHTARGDKPLSSLDASIKEGNSLIDSDFYKSQSNMAFYDDEQKERINAFDWWDAFPEVKARGGFDAVVGNPPYVKLQNFRKVHGDMADFLKFGSGGDVPYLSTQTGNFDLYLPFIERGLALLNDNGRLGYIAPSLWTVNEYGEGLRFNVMKNGQLDRWVDFKAHQIFEEATVYTALMFFTKRKNETVRIVSAPDGVIATDAFANDNGALPYARLPFHDRWLMLTGPERDLIDRLSATCSPLDDTSLTNAIYQGLITSADPIYHLKKVGPGRYRSYADKDQDDGYEVDIEDALMKPLISGTEAKRYQTPKTDTYLLFPYQLANRVSLIVPATMARDFPNAWNYLQAWEAQLRRREAKIDKDTGDFTLDEEGKIEHAPFNDDEWYRFGRHQNLDKQESPKLVVPRLVANLTCTVDPDGGVYLDNVDVGGVQAADGVDLFWLAGLMNSSVLRFVFKRISKPFRGDYLSANKQFIAPLPVPNASDPAKKDIADRARALQADHSRRRDLLDLIARRMKTLRTRSKPETWLFAGLKSKADWEKDAPAGYDLSERRAYAKKRFEDAVAVAESTVGERVRPGVSMDAAFKDGELSFLIDGVPVITSIFLDDAAGAFTLAQWKVIAASFPITEKTDGKKLCTALRKLADADGSDAVQQVLGFQAELETLDRSIKGQEAAMNAAVCELYGLTDAERALVERG